MHFRRFLTLFARGGGGIVPPCHVFVYNWLYTHTSVLKNLTFPLHEFGKGQYAFYPMKLSRFAEKNEVLQKYQNFIRWTLPNLVKRASTQKTFQKSSIILEGSRTPNFINLFENGKLFQYTPGPNF